MHISVRKRINNLFKHDACVLCKLVLQITLPFSSRRFHIRYATQQAVHYISFYVHLNRPNFQKLSIILHGGHEDEVVSKDGARAAAQHLSLCSWDWKFVCSLLKVFDNPSRTCLTYFSIDSTWLKYNNESSIIFELAISISLDSRVLTHQRQLTSFLLPITLQSFANGKRTSTHKPQSDCKREYGSNIFGGERQRQNAGGVQDSRPISQAESTFKLNGLGR